MSVVYHTGNMRSKRNMLINSDFKINQRGYVSGTNTTVANQYTLDRWRIPTKGQNATFSETNGIVTITAPASGIEQVIENISNKGGEFTVYNQGTAVVTVSQSSDNITYTAVIPVNGVYNITGGNYIKVNFASGTVILPTFKDGSVIDTVWHPYDGEFGGEVQACARYYEVIGRVVNQPIINVAYYATTVAFGVLTYLEKRVIPTISRSRDTMFNIYRSGATIPSTSVAFSSGVGKTSARVDITTATSPLGVAGWAELASNSEYIALSAEL